MKKKTTISPAPAGRQYIKPETTVVEMQGAQMIATSEPDFSDDELRSLTATVESVGVTLTTPTDC